MPGLVKTLLIILFIKIGMLCVPSVEEDLIATFRRSCFLRLWNVLHENISLLVFVLNSAQP